MFAIIFMTGKFRPCHKNYCNHKNYCSFHGCSAIYNIAVIIYSLYVLCEDMQHIISYESYAANYMRFEGRTLKYEILSILEPLKF